MAALFEAIRSGNPLPGNALSNSHNRGQGKCSRAPALRLLAIFDPLVRSGR